MSVPFISILEILSQILQYLFAGITAGSIYAIIALGFTVIYKCTEVVNFAQGEFVMLGAIVAAWTISALNWPLPLAFLVAVVVTTVIGAGLGFVTLPPLKRASVVTLIIITVGASILLRGASMLVFGQDALPMPQFSQGAFIVAEAVIMPQSLWILGVGLACVILLRLFYDKTMIGRAMRATACCKEGAQTVGININRMVVISFALAGALGAVAGVLVAPISLASFDMGTMLGLKGFCAAIFGGLGNFGGGILAGLILGVIESFGAGYISSQYKDAIAFILLLAVLFFRPQGVLTRGSSK